MKRRAIIFGLVFVFLMGSLGIGQIQAICSQEELPDSKLLSSKELAKELRKSNSERLKFWGYYTKIYFDLYYLDSRMRRLDPEIALRVASKIQSDPELKIYFGADPKERGRLVDTLLAKKFDFNQFEQAFNKFQNIYIKLIICMQEGLDLSQEEHKAALKASTELLEKIKNPALIFQGMSQYKKDYLRSFHIFRFIQVWAQVNLVILDKELLEGIVIVGEAADKYLRDEAIDHDSKEFKKIFPKHMKELNKRINRLIKFIKKSDSNKRKGAQAPFLVAKNFECGKMIRRV